LEYYNISESETYCGFSAINTVYTNLTNVLFYVNAAIDGFGCERIEVAPFVKVNGNLLNVSLFGYINITNSVNSTNIKMY
jgi:hypothetical protein